jgi:hypothetical protein
MSLQTIMKEVEAMQRRHGYRLSDDTVLSIFRNRGYNLTENDLRFVRNNVDKKIILIDRF